MERARYEMDMIEKAGFINYFLVVWDYVRFARRRTFRLARGAARHLEAFVAYALGITDIDPLRYGLIFERLLNPACFQRPDIDIDFCMKRRGEVVEYVKQKYGHDKVAHISTFASSGRDAPPGTFLWAMEVPSRIGEKLVDLLAPGGSRPEWIRRGCWAAGGKSANPPMRARAVRRKIHRGNHPHPGGRDRQSYGLTRLCWKACPATRDPRRWAGNLGRSDR